MSVLWGGRFGGGLDPEFAAFNRSLPVDAAMVLEDLLGSLAWADALQGAGVLTGDERDELHEALRRLGTRLHEEGIPDEGDEDVHGLVERLLTEELGPLARKLHTGRSRNDQVATDLKLHLKLRGHEILEAATALMQTLVDRAEEWASLPIPGYTHLQRAQPVTAGHWALAYVEMLERDRGRLVDALDRMDTCPLGSGALAGTAFPVDRETVAERLGFVGGATGNSMDAVSDRDHVLELAFVCSTIMIHLSRLAEDAIFFACQEVGLLHFTDAVATGSSLMPQKKNPDAMELVRGKCGRVVGALQGLMVTLKGLPLAYDKDLQEDKEALFESLDTTVASLRVTRTAVIAMGFDVDRCHRATATGYLNATDLADLLVQEGVPFRDAHERVGEAVKRALARNIELQDLPDEDREELLPELDGQDLGALLSVDAVLARRDVVGGTAPRRVMVEIGAWRERLAEEEDDEDEEEEEP